MSFIDNQLPSGHGVFFIPKRSASLRTGSHAKL